MSDARSKMMRHTFWLPTSSGAVSAARRATVSILKTFGVAPGTSFVDGVVLIVCELVANTVRHAADRSPTVEVVLIAGDGRVVIEVADQDPAIPSITTGRGLLTILELAEEYGGTLSVTPAPRGGGKIMRVLLPLPNTRASQPGY
ncbi:ATP-binding protein [Actinacidiphila glaucinigra]|uniref:ATP-binding protein n=1 Tax=Actinacidiphila glaucinigra TaxID=235986 RepID=UPI0035D56DE1